MENHLGIKQYAFVPVYCEDDGESDSDDSDLERNFDSEQVEITDWCGCEVSVFLSERECICCHEWDILKEKLEVEDVDCVTQHMDFDSACLNPSVLATSYVTCMRFKGIGSWAQAILINNFFLNNWYSSEIFLIESTSFVKSFLSAAKVYVRAVPSLDIKSMSIYILLLKQLIWANTYFSALTGFLTFLTTIVGASLMM